MRVTIVDTIYRDDTQREVMFFVCSVEGATGLYNISCQNMTGVQLTQSVGFTSKKQPLMTDVVHNPMPPAAGKHFKGGFTSSAQKLLRFSSCSIYCAKTNE